MTRLVTVISIVLLLALCVQASDYKLSLRTAAPSKVWQDTGSGADEDVSIWRPVNIPSGYYPVGDIAISPLARPHNIPVVHELESGVLAEPVSISLVWNDKGSGADDDVAIYRLNPPTGYTCLGDIAIKSHTVRPDKRNYRCVKDTYLVAADLQLIWTDKGSDADKDVSLWKAVGSFSKYETLTFLSYPHHRAPSGRPGRALNSRNAYWQTRGK